MTRTPLVPSDLGRLALPTDPRCGPDGRIYYVLATHDLETDETRTAIYVVRPGSAPVRFSSGTKDRSPRVAPDGTSLAFIGDRGDGKRIYVAPLGGGEASAVTPAYDALSGLAWSRDSKTLAFVATTPLDAATARIALDERSGARHIRALPYKSDDDGLLDGRRRHLFTVGLDDAVPVRLTHGDFDVSSPAWSPRGDRLAFVAQIDAPETAFYADVFTVARTGGELVKLTRSRGPCAAPSYANDGREIAYLGHERGDDAGGRFNEELFVIGSDGGEPRSLTATVDRAVTDYVMSDSRVSAGTMAPAWSSNDAEIFVSLSREGTCAVAAFSRDGASHRTAVGGERDVFAFAYRADGALAFAYTSPTVPGEVAFLSAEGEERVLTNCNPWLVERSIRAPRRVRPAAADGTILDLWLLDPDADVATEAPYVLEVHGGPHTAYGYAFVFEFQMLAAHGLGVAYGNPRGSQSYGEAYANAILGDWGGIDASDVLALLDGTLANANVDASRVGLAGGSYGGFMTTWLLGHSDRFAAGVSMRAVNDFVSEVGATDLGWFLERELDAPWTDGGAKLFATSPMRRAHEIVAPLLVEHSERDYRCAIDQGEQLFTLLRRLGRTQTEFVRFTGDGHGLSRTGKPRNRILRLRAIAHWFVRHLKPAGGVPPGDEAGSLFAPLATEPAEEPVTAS